MNILPSSLLPADRRAAPTFGIRAESIRLADGPGTFTARVARVEQIGASTVVHLEAEGNELAARTTRRDTPDVGSDVAVAFSDEDIRYFESEDGRAVAAR